MPCAMFISHRSGRSAPVLLRVTGAAPRDVEAVASGAAHGSDGGELEVSDPRAVDPDKALGGAKRAKRAKCAKPGRSHVQVVESVVVRLR